MNKVVLDPGHGGADPGAVGPTKLHEAVVNLAIAELVASKIGVAQAVLTRSAEVTLQPATRFRPTKGAAAFVSIHCNAATNRAASGTEVLYSARDPESRKLADSIHQRLTRALGRRDRGLKQAETLYVLNRAVCPACLVEVAFVSNPEEERLLADPAFQERAAGAIADGIRAFLASPTERG